MISKFERRVVGDGVEIVVAIDQAGQTLLDDVEERVERRECRVLRIGHDLLLGCCTEGSEGSELIIDTDSAQQQRWSMRRDERSVLREHFGLSIVSSDPYY